jgi:RNA polymerase sigma-70 factor (ECF subfamily)
VDDDRLVEDNRLIDEALAGKTDSFGRLVERYQDRLFHAMTHVAGSVEDAHDIVQDAFTQAFVKLESFRGASAFYTWLYRIAFNVAASRRRRARPTVSTDRQQADRGEQVIDPRAAPHERLEQQERAERVHAALASLPDEYRQVMVLREMDDCSYEVIAEILDLPVGTVRSRLHRARTQMRELLKEVLEIERE